jgi:hypothetical protein
MKALNTNITKLLPVEAVLTHEDTQTEQQTARHDEVYWRFCPFKKTILSTINISDTLQCSYVASVFILVLFTHYLNLSKSQYCTEQLRNY